MYAHSQPRGRFLGMYEGSLGVRLAEEPRAAVLLVHLCGRRGRPEVEGAVHLGFLVTHPLPDKNGFFLPRHANSKILEFGEFWANFCGTWETFHITQRLFFNKRAARRLQGFRSGGL